MQEFLEKVDSLNKQVKATIEQLSLDDIRTQMKNLGQESEKLDFWQDSNNAQTVMKKIASLHARVSPWDDLLAKVSDLQDMAQLQDDTLQSELNAQFQTLSAQYYVLKKDLQFSGPYDNFNVILGIHAGAGGTDAQDWAQMLLRMYVRWAEAHKYPVKMIDESAGEEAGIKSATIEIEGAFIFGKLKGEHGVHRLVRLSPFNADNLRQTSFAKVEIMPKIDTPDAVEIDEKDLKIDVYRSGGHGGQSVNTTDSAVRVTHLPTNIVVAIQNERSQIQNKETAMTILRSKLAQLQIEQHAERVSELKGPNQSAEWGNQIRSYVLHPYKQVKDLRTKYETSDPDAVLDGKLDDLIAAYLEFNVGDTK